MSGMVAASKAAIVSNPPAGPGSAVNVASEVTSDAVFEALVRGDVATLEAMLQRAADAKPLVRVGN